MIFATTAAERRTLLALALVLVLALALAAGR